MPINADARTVDGFGDEWSAFDQTALSDEETSSLFNAYFSVFPFDRLPPAAEGFDFGCGSGRWAKRAVQRVGTLHCIDASPKALEVAQRVLADSSNVRFHLATPETIPLADASQDFGYSLGVLHHIPNTQEAMNACVRKLKTGAPFLIYLYYNFDNRNALFGGLWKLSDVGRRVISRLPFGFRKLVTEGIAAAVYWPLARSSRLAERFGAKMEAWPLSAYRNLSYYTMRTDALDRFGTRLEQRFSRADMQTMMRLSGLEEIRFRDAVPYWVACGFRAKGKDPAI